MNPSKPNRENRFNRTVGARTSQGSEQSKADTGFKKKSPKMSLQDQILGRPPKSQRPSHSSDLQFSRSNRSVYSSINSKLLSNPPELQDINVIQVFKENQELKIMELSQDCRDNLKKMQRFDRFIYPIQSDRILKIPMQKQVKRLQKIKNQNVRMRGKIYDNQLTITALYNHVKLVFQMNRQLEEREVLRRQKQALSQRIHEISMNNKKQVRQLKEQMRQQSIATSPMKMPPRPSQQTTPQKSLNKQQTTALNFIAATIEGKKYQQAQKQIANFMKKYGQKQQLCKMMKVITKVIKEETTIQKTVTILQAGMNQSNTLIQKISKLIRLQQLDQLNKIKNENMRTEHKNIALMIQSFMNSIKKLQETADRNKKQPQSRSKDKLAAKQYQKIEEQLKKVKQELSKQKIIAADHLKAKHSLEKQLQKMKGIQQQLQKLKKQKNVKTQNSQLAKLIIELANERESKKQLQKNLTQLSNKLNQSKEQKQNQKPTDKQLQKQVVQLKKSEANLKANLQNAKKSDSLMISKLKAEVQEQKNLAAQLQTKLKGYEQVSKEKNNKKVADQQSHINKQKQLQAQIAKLNSEINSLKKTQKSRQQNQQTKAQYQSQIKELKSEIVSSKSQYQTIKNNITKVTNLLRGKLRPQQVSKLKKDLQKNEVSLNLLQVYVIFESEKQKYQKSSIETLNKQKQKKSELQTSIKNLKQNAKQMQNLVNSYEKITSSMQNVYKNLEKRKNDILNKNASISDIIIGQLKRQKISDSIGITVELSNLSKWIQQLFNIQLTTKKQQFSKIQSEQANQLRTIQHQFNQYRKQFKTDQSAQQIAQKCLRNLQSALNRLRGQQLLGNGKIMNLYKKQLDGLKNTKYGFVIVAFEDMIEYIVNSSNDELIRKQDISTNKIDAIKEQKSKIEQELQISIRQSNEKAHQYRQVQQIKRQLNRQIQFLKKSNAKLQNQKHILETRDSQNNTQISKLKKTTQQYIRQQKKILQKMQALQKQKQKIMIERDAHQRTIQRQNKQKQFYEMNLKKQDSQVLKLKQIQIIHENAYKDFELKIEVLQNNYNAKQRQIMTVYDKNKMLQNQKNKTDSMNNQLQKTLQKKKDQIQRLQSNYRDKIDTLQKQKYQLNRNIDHLKTEIKYLKQENQLERRRLQTTITKQQSTIHKLQHQNSQQRQQAQIKLSNIIKQKQALRSSFQREQTKYRQKLRDVSFKLQQTTGSDQRQKVQLRKQLQRINNELLDQTSRFTIQRQELRRYNDKLGNDLRILQHEKQQERRILRQQIQRVRSQQYESNRQKMTKFKEQIKQLQDQISKYTEIIQINEDNYNKIVQDNKDMYEKNLQLHKQISEVSSQLRIKTDQNTRNKQLSIYIEKLQVKVKQLEKQVHKQNQQQTIKSDQLQKNNAIRMQQKYEHLNQFERVTKQNIALKNDVKNYSQLTSEQQKIINQLQSSRLQIEKAVRDRQTELSEKRNALFQQQYSLNQKQADILQKTTQISRLHQQIIALKRQIDSKADKIIDHEKQIRILQAKIHQKDRNSFQTQINLKKELQIQTSRLQNAKIQLNELKASRQSIQQRQKAIQIKYDQQTKQVTYLKIQNNRIQRDIIYWRQRAQKQEQQILNRNNSQVVYQNNLNETTQMLKKHEKIQAVNIQLKTRNEHLQKRHNQYETKIYQLKTQYQEMYLKQKTQQMQSHNKQTNYKYSIESLEKSREQLLKKVYEKQNQLDLIKKKFDEKVQQQLNQVKDLERKVTHHKQMEIKLTRRADSAENQAKQHQRSLMMLQNQLKIKKQAIQAKDRQIHHINANYLKIIQGNKQQSHHTYSHTTVTLLENSIQQKKRQIQRLQSQLNTQTKIFNDKNQESSRLQIELKQSQMQKIMIQDKLKQRAQNLGQKLKQERQRWRTDKYKLQTIITQLESSNKSLKNKYDSLVGRYENTQNQLQKVRITYENVERREKQMRDRYYSKQQQLRKVYQKQQTIINGNTQIHQQNKHLKGLLHMLDQNYTFDTEEDLNQIQILMKISNQISELIDRNIWLQKQLKRANLQSDDPWYDSLDILVDSITNFAYENNIIGRKHRTLKFLQSHEFRNSLDKDLALQKYMMHIENYFRSLLSSISIDPQINQISALYERTLIQMKNFVHNYQKTKDQIYINSVIRCLTEFQP